MADDRKKTGKADHTRINVGQSYEVRYWAKKLGVTQVELKKAVKKVGPTVKKVKQALT